MIAFGSIMLWLRGIRVNSNAWAIKANFPDASGLTVRSPVTYRGIIIGEIGEIKVKPEAVQATLRINKPDLLLPHPVIARVVKNSLLGGDIQVSLVSSGEPIPDNIPLPGDDNCSQSQVLCNGSKIEGEPLTSLSTLTTQIERLVRTAGKEDIVKKMIDSMNQFDQTQIELEELILQAKTEVNRAKPIIKELTGASTHLNNILAAIDNEETLENITETISNSRSLSKKIDIMGEEINQLMDDEELIDAIRKVTIGLGQFFDEVYPAKTNRGKVNY